tara:strand:+ start:2122 stop:3021 length:900 start_codon:yes stop_codon:yes gene_type:complete
LKKIILAHIALIFANLIYAINFTLAKDVMPEYIMPSGFILLRVSSAVILFSIVYFLFIRERVKKKDLIKLAVCGLFGVAVNQLFFFEGLNLTSPINASIIMTTNPIIVLVISFVILKDKITGYKLFGVLLGIFGAWNLILNSNNMSFSSGSGLGDIFVLINATSYGLYLVLVKPLMSKYNPITILFIVFSFGLIFVFPFGYNELSLVDWTEIPNNIWFEIGFVVLFTTFFAYLLNAFALKNVSPNTVSIYIYLQPVLASFFAIYWGADELKEDKIIAALFIFAGVYLVSKESEKRSKLS